MDRRRAAGVGRFTLRRRLAGGPLAWSGRVRLGCGATLLRRRIEGWQDRVLHAQPRDAPLRPRPVSTLRRSSLLVPRRPPAATYRRRSKPQSSDGWRTPAVDRNSFRWAVSSRASVRQFAIAIAFWRGGTRPSAHLQVLGAAADSRGMRILILALFLISILPCAWAGSNSTFSGRVAPRWKSGAKGRAAGAPARKVQPNSRAAPAQTTKGVIHSLPPRRAFPLSRPRPPTGPPSRICRGCR